MASQIFDRIDMVQLLNDTCLADGGTSSAIICAQKTGKSYLLNHVYESHAEQFTSGQRVVFCTLNVDLLQSMIQTQKSNPDQAFLLFFCQRLQDQLETWVENLSRGESDRKTEIQDLTQEIAAATGNVQNAMQLKKSSLETQQNELERLKTILVLLDPLANNTRPIDIPTVARVLDKLKRIEKRVILVIDDFARMLDKRDLNLSDAVFNFLRGASTEKKLVTLVSSKLHPMDPELHDNTERPALVNHLQVQHLAPFTRSQAEDFLHWISQPWIERGSAPLDQEQIAYLAELGGGCPFFLETAHRIFEINGRPGPMRRAEFENGDLAALLEPSFREVWKRCSPDQRAMLKDIATGNAIATASRTALRLDREGYIIISGADSPLFSRLFAAFVRTAKGDPPPSIQVKASVNYRAFPSAFAIAQPNETHALVSFQVDNATGDDVKVTVDAQVKDYTHLIPRLIDVPPKSAKSAELQFTLQASFPETGDARYAPVVFTAYQELPGGARTPLVNDSARLRILPLDTFVFARRNVREGKLIDWSWMIAAWVSRNQSQIGDILQAAREINGGSTTGYAVSGDVPTGVRKQVAALYQALQNSKISYDDSATVFHQDDQDFAQRVRLPHRSLADKRANCLDGSVLFASLLTSIGLHAIILLLPRVSIT